MRVILRKYKRKSIFLGIIIQIILVFISILYLRYIKIVLINESEIYLGRLSENQKVSIDNELKLRIETLESIGRIHKINDPQIDILEKVQILAEDVIKRDESRIGISDINGNAFTTDNFNINISDTKFFKEIQSGKNYSTENTKNKVDNSNIFVCAIPIRNNNEIVGVLFSTEEARIKNDLKESIFYINGVNQFIVNELGEVISRNGNNNVSIGDNYFDVLKLNNPLKEVENIENRLKKKEDSIKIMRYYTDEVFISFSSFDYTDELYSIVSIDKQIVVGDRSSIVNASLLLLFSLICVVLVSIFTLVRHSYNYKYLREENYMKKKFLSNISHEIRTPMNGIIGSTELALANKDNPEKIDYYLEKVMIASNNLLGLLNDLLVMSKSGSGEIELYESEVDFNEIVKGINAITKAMILEKDLNFTVNLHNIEKINVICDKSKLEQILINLITNAIRYTNDNGEITFSIELIERLSNNQGKFVFTVQDTGIGMSEEFMTRMFLPFVQADSSNSRSVGGAGLGLAITKSLVELMNGEISVKSKVNKGTKIDVTLVLTIVDVKDEVYKEESTDIHLDGAKKIFKDKRVLLVEDDEINRIVQSEVFKNLGFQVEVAENGKEALEMFVKSSEGHYDIIIMDIQMPLMDGYEASTKIRESKHKNAKDIKIIGMTASTIIEDLELAMKCGMNDCLSKPIEIKKLTDKLEKILY